MDNAVSFENAVREAIWVELDKLNCSPVIVKSHDKNISKPVRVTYVPERLCNDRIRDKITYKLCTIKTPPNSVLIVRLSDFMDSKGWKLTKTVFSSDKDKYMTLLLQSKQPRMTSIYNIPIPLRATGMDLVDIIQINTNSPDCKCECVTKTKRSRR